MPCPEPPTNWFVPSSNTGCCMFPERHRPLHIQGCNQQYRPGNGLNTAQEKGLGYKTKETIN